MTTQEEREGQLLLNKIVTNMMYTSKPYIIRDDKKVPGVRELTETEKQAKVLNIAMELSTKEFLKENYGKRLLNPDSFMCYYFYSSLPGFMQCKSLEEARHAIIGLVQYINEHHKYELDNGAKAQAKNQVRTINMPYEEKVALYGHNLIEINTVYYLANDTKGSRKELYRASGLTYEQIIDQFMEQDRLTFAQTVMSKIQEQSEFSFDKPVEEQDLVSDYKFAALQYLLILSITAFESKPQDSWLDVEVEDFHQLEQWLSKEISGRRANIAAERMSQPMEGPMEAMVRGLGVSTKKDHAVKSGSNITLPKKKRKK